MALTEKQIMALRSKYSLGQGTPVKTTDTRANDRISRLKAGNQPSQENTAQLSTDEALALGAEGGTKKEGLFSRIGTALKERGREIKEAFGRGLEQSPLSTALQVGGQVAGGVLDVGFEGARSAFRVATKEEDVKRLGEEVQRFFQTEKGKKAATALEIGSEAWGQFKEEHPTTAANIEAVGNIVSVAPAVKGVGVAKRTVTGAKEGIEKATAGVVKKVTRKPVKKAKALEEIGEKIAPKMTKKEVSKALSEGRLIRGKKSRIFGVKPDTVKVSKQVDRAAKTVEEMIPNARKLADAEIATQALKEIGGISQKLSPTLKKTKILDDTKNDLLNSWLKIKDDQVAGVGRKLSQSRLKGAQKEFEDVLLEIVDADNLDEVWNLRKKYDEIIPSNVKRATDTSSEGLQFEREMWLENRRVLNDIMEDMTKELDEGAKTAFDQMEDLYRARTNIINRADITKKKKRGFLFKVGGAALTGSVFGKFLID